MRDYKKNRNGSNWKSWVAMIAGLGVLVLVCLPFLVGSTVQGADAKSPKEGVVSTDQVKGLVMYQEPALQSNQVTVIPNGETVQTLSEDAGWAHISYQSKEGYVRGEALRYYSPFSINDAKAITDHVIHLQRQTWQGNFTNRELSDLLAPGFSEAYINKYVSQLFRQAGENESGQPLYHIVESEIYGYAIDAFDWKGTDTDPPTIKHYTQNGQEYLVISQYHLNAESGDHLSTLYLSRDSADSNWRVTDYITVY